MPESGTSKAIPDVAGLCSLGDETLGEPWLAGRTEEYLPDVGRDGRRADLGLSTAVVCCMSSLFAM